MGETEKQYQRGDACGKTAGCGGKLVVYHSHLIRSYRVRKLRCNTCRKLHGKSLAPNELAEQVADMDARLKKLEDSNAQHATFINSTQ